ncbi:ABC transporter permease [Halobacteriaceae archaeon GCM10025711]
MKGKWNWRFVKLVALVVYLSMLVPLSVIVINSFHPSRIPSFPPPSISLRWYAEFFQDEAMLSAILVSLKVSVVAALASGVIATLTALGFVRKRFPFKQTLVIALLSPMLVPPIIIGVSSTIYFTEIGWDRSIWWLAVMHTLVVLPYAFLIIRSRLYLFDESLEEAARTLGADKLTTFREVTLPIVSPAIITAMVIAFVISFGEFTATQFWVTSETQTVPVMIYSMVRTLITPKVNVLATMVLVVTTAIPLLGLLATRYLNLTRA